MIWHLDLAFRIGINIWQTILPDLDLPKWFAKSIWHLDLANHFAGPRFV
jgi:hypothetical protein